LKGRKLRAIIDSVMNGLRRWCLLLLLGLVAAACENKVPVSLTASSSDTDDELWISYRVGGTVQDQFLSKGSSWTKSTFADAGDVVSLRAMAINGMVLVSISASGGGCTDSNAAGQWAACTISVGTDSLSSTTAPECCGSFEPGSRFAVHPEGRAARVGP
jgi:hypothetical protein